ncbi:Oligosaccharyl transferase, STT3 subunit [Sulfurimonas denitrificans DSM 1251]|uniref:Oligosaccharyl transferase, STT3 subunit n=1 Tax=Sulfurimonas denitrificans (strain ATCC 33889 / DSM 1251) TaxID=326298 RepID=Q30QI0_SULDN|nr:STT3 domain-containing protein [Sulfurimonas denitrificans]ABB44751.1 Oligosaccharyl transferase, STT3 subunit [Sulfurimonas denitrificans DSM 1251]MDD3443013.1 STT3 domain-containing protein [Sulfurimonas denitrificans]
MLTFTKETKVTLLYIALAFLFSVAIRMIWFYQFVDYEPFRFNAQLMINTNDGYYWAEGARDILAGVHQDNDLSAVDLAASQLSALFAYILPFSFESVILFMPVFLGSLIVIPIILIAKSIDNLEMGFIAALLASIAHSYYNRTMIGYYDTDMLNIVLPMFLLWSIIWAVRTNQDKYLLITAVDILIYRWWYPQSYSLESAFFALILLYTLLYERKNSYNYKLLAIMMFAMVGFEGYIRAIFVLIAFYMYKQEKYDRYVHSVLAFSIVLFFVSGGFNPIWEQLSGYVFKDAISVGQEGLKLHFYSVKQTIREAANIPFITFANRISGHVITFLASIIGYIYLVYKHKVMLFGLPLIGLGFLAYVGGLRFTIYAVPVLAFGVAFLISEIARFMPNRRVKVFSMSALTLLILLPNIVHIEAYRVPTVFNADEVKVLDMLRGKANREDYVVAWWDYGYPIRYYSDVKTLIDGGKHRGDVNFPVSFMLTNPQDVSAKLARLDVEYSENSFEDKNPTMFSNIEKMTKEYGFSDTNDFLLSLEGEIELPKKTRDIYFYLPHRMLDIYPTVEIFSNLDLMNGNMKNRSFFYATKQFRQEQNILNLSQGVVVDLKEFSVNINNNKVPIKRVIQSAYDKNMKFTKEVELVNPNGELNLIFMSSYNTFLVVDEKTYNSVYIQLSVLQEYDKMLFEEVIITPHAKVYKLKI